MKTLTDTERFVADTHALIWNLSEDPRLSKEARRRFLQAEEGESIIYFATISIIEVLYLLEKGKIPTTVWELLRLTLKTHPHGSYQVVDLTADLSFLLAKVPRESVPELPDRIIAATALSMQLPLITKDERLQQWEGIQTIW